MVGFVVFNKLPTQLKKALIDKTGTNYPSIKDILDHHFESIKMLRVTKYTPNCERSEKGGKSGAAPIALQNFATNTSLVNQQSDYSCRSLEHRVILSLCALGITLNKSHLPDVRQQDCVPYVPVLNTTRASAPARTVN